MTTRFLVEYLFHDRYHHKLQNVDFGLFTNGSSSVFGKPVFIILSKHVTSGGQNYNVSRMDEIRMAHLTLMINADKLSLSKNSTRRKTSEDNIRRDLRTVGEIITDGRVEVAQDKSRRRGFVRYDLSHVVVILMYSDKRRVIRKGDKTETEKFRIGQPDQTTSGIAFVSMVRRIFKIRSFQCF